MKPERRLHLLCNAHLDPVWLWEWPEGAAEALSTFRTAADFCDEYKGFVFNHNEAILYQWIEEYDPKLFKRIRKLVEKGRWHIMGGWFLQPDCNMPSGEGIVRQILTGRLYFEKKFGVRPTTAMNFDPFGHARGLAQIMAKSGYDFYLFTRPHASLLELPADEFEWVGHDGSTVIGVRSKLHYNSHLGKVGEKYERHKEVYGDDDCTQMMWGIGDHGGGPSRIDMETLRQIKRDEKREMEILHSTPEDFFADLTSRDRTFPQYHDSINVFAPGCFTSQARIKQHYRALENEFLMTEKMCCAAEDSMKYPKEELADAQRDLMFAMFHDILPGSSIQPVEDQALQMMGHGREILSRVKTRAFIALSAAEKPAKDDEFPILVYNPHPWEVDAVIPCEYMHRTHNWSGTLRTPQVFSGKKELPSQPEKTLCNLNLDWRGRVVFQARLKPSQMHRFSCRFEELPPPEPKPLPERGDVMEFKTDRLRVAINKKTGLLDRYAVDGKDYLEKGAFLPLVINDNEDPWGMRVTSYREVIGKFTLMTQRDAARFAGVKRARLVPIRVIEDGDVRTVVEVLLKYNHSFIALHYSLPKTGTEVEVGLRVYWNEKDRMLKLRVPVGKKARRYLGQTAYGVDELKSDGSEVVAQRWVAAATDSEAVTIVNDCLYGSDFKNGEINLSLLRSASYSGHPMGDREIVPQDRFTPRIDQGERLYTFWLNAGPVTKRLTSVSREADEHNEKPMALSMNPSGQGKKAGPCVKLSDKCVQLAAMKRAEKGKAWIVRLFEPTGRKRKTNLSFPQHGLKTNVSLRPFEIKTLKIDLKKGSIKETNLIEEPLG